MKTIARGFGCMLAVTLAATRADAQTTPKYSAKVPPYITTPDKVETNIGTLKFFDGLPDAETVQMVYDNLDRAAGLKRFSPACPPHRFTQCAKGISQVGVKPNANFGIMQDLMDARSVYLTANSTTAYVFGCLRLPPGLA
jgi:hypothetical protein